MKEDVEKLKEDAIYEKGFKDGAVWAGGKFILVCSTVVTGATAFIYWFASVLYSNTDKIGKIWGVINGN